MCTFQFKLALRGPTEDLTVHGIKVEVCLLVKVEVISRTTLYRRKPSKEQMSLNDFHTILLSTFSEDFYRKRKRKESYKVARDYSKWDAISFAQ